MNQFLKRATSFTWFRVVGKFSFSQEKYQEALNQYAFKDLSQFPESDLSVGWVSTENCLQPPALDLMMTEPYFRLMMRVDRRKISPAIMSAHLEIEEKAALENAGKKKLSPREKTELRLSVKKFLMEKATPTTSLYRALWNFRTASCFLLSNSRSVHKQFNKLFSQTFGMELEPLDSWSLAVLWAEENHQTKTLETLEATSFGVEV